MRRAWSWNSSTHRPVRKKVAGTQFRSRVARIDGTPSALAPAAKVSATTLRLVSSTVSSRPRSAAGTPLPPRSRVLLPGEANPRSQPSP